MNNTNAKLETKRIIIYLCITFILTILYCVLVIYPLNNSQNIQTVPAAMLQLLVAAAMFFPALGTLLTRLVTKEGFKNAWLRPHFKNHIKFYLLAYFGPGLLTLLGSILYFVIYPQSFDPNCGYMLATLEATGTTVDTLPMSLSTLLLIQGIQALLLGPILNFITCFGEEWGWRGYLLPKMSQKLPLIPMLLVNGIIWGLWHAPLTIIGHNYGINYPGFPYAGIAAMCGFCTVIGVFLSFVSLKTQSCIPAVLGHGAMNSIAAIGIYFTRDGGNPFVGPAPTGIIGILPFLIIAIFMIIHLHRQEN